MSNPLEDPPGADYEPEPLLLQLREEVLNEVPCPYCFAEKGERCLNDWPDHERVRHVHDDRILAFMIERDCWP